jgi:hypothetical protein
MGGEAVYAGRVLDALEKEWRRRAEASDYFVWPRSYVLSATGTLDSIDAQDRGILSALGYRVGKVHGQSIEVRVFLLDYVFSHTLTPLKWPFIRAEVGEFAARWMLSRRSAKLSRRHSKRRSRNR